MYIHARIRTRTVYTHTHAHTRTKHRYIHRYKRDTETNIHINTHRTQIITRKTMAQWTGSLVKRQRVARGKIQDELMTRPQGVGFLKRFTCTTNVPCCTNCGWCRDDIPYPEKEQTKDAPNICSQTCTRRQVRHMCDVFFRIRSYGFGPLKISQRKRNRRKSADLENIQI